MNPYWWGNARGFIQQYAKLLRRDLRNLQQDWNKRLERVVAIRDAGVSGFITCALSTEEKKELDHTQEECYKSIKFWSRCQRIFEEYCATAEVLHVPLLYQFPRVRRIIKISRTTLGEIEQILDPVI